MSDNGVLQLTA